jgi:hypothetical protein
MNGRVGDWVSERGRNAETQRQRDEEPERRRRKPQSWSER